MGLVPREIFMTDEFRQSAVIRQLEIAGEAAGRLSETFGRAHPAMEAREMKAFAQCANPWLCRSGFGDGVGDYSE